MSLLVDWIDTPGDAAAPERGATSTLTHRLLLALGLPDGAVQDAMRLAARRGDGDDAATVLMADGRLAPDVWWPALAAALGLAYHARIEPLAAPPDVFSDARQDREAQHVWIADGDRASLAVAPRGLTTARLSGFLATHPALRTSVVIAPREAVRDGVRRQLQATMTHAALSQLVRTRPSMSAARPPSARLVRLAGGALALAPFLIVLFGLGVEFLLLGVFLPLALLRFAAATQTAALEPPPSLADDALPRYAVLVPLYREAEMLPQLATALAALDYPRDKLDLKLLLEADDGPTRAAAAAHAARGGWDIVVVPPSLPRTKPKALAFALQLIDAELVTVFDAEDRPAPDQLRRAAAAFAAAPANVACLQGILTIDRPRGLRGRWLAGQFALEYRILFEGLLPWLASLSGFFLLGGTSNHFRRDALAAVGGWDPYNVTEDADVAVRLARAGWRLGVLASETHEEAPTRRRVWMAQRCRWLKGWMQTWFVHMRRPLRLLRDLGLGRFLMFQLLLGGQILSAFAFPASVVAAAMLFLGVRPLIEIRGFLADLGLMTAIATGTIAWSATTALALQTAPPGRRLTTLLQAVTLPFYWLLLYPAVIRAALELATAPFQWNKTPHGDKRATRWRRRSSGRVADATTETDTPRRVRS